MLQIFDSILMLHAMKSKGLHIFNETLYTLYMQLLLNEQIKPTRVNKICSLLLNNKTSMNVTALY